MLWAMLGVLLLASYLRIHDLNDQGLWGDEGWSLWLARGDSVQDLTWTMVHDHHGPEYSIMLRAWEAVVGGTVVALRMEAVLFSIASIALLYRVGRVLFTPEAGVLAALVFTLLDKQVVLTQEVRDYPMVFFVMMTTAYCYIEWRQHPRRGWAFGYVLSTILGLYLHYYTYMVNVAIVLHALITLRGREPWRNFVAINAAAVLAFAPWIPVVVYQFTNTPVNVEVLTIHGMPTNWHTLKYLAVESFGTPVALNGMLLFTGALAPLLARTPGVMSRIPRDRRLSDTLLAVLWFAVPIFFTVGMAPYFPMLTDRNVSVIMVPIALLAGYGLTAFGRFGRGWLVAFMVINGVFTTSSYFVHPPSRAMATDIAARYAADDPVLMDVEGEHAALWYHLKLALPAEAEDQIVSLYDYRKRYGYDFLAYVKAHLDQTDGLWMPYWGEEWKKHDVIDLLAQEGFVRTGTLTYYHAGAPIYVFRYDRASVLDQQITQYGEHITLHKAVARDGVNQGDTLPVQLWWSTDAPLEADYSVSVFLLDSSGVLRAQHDSYPATGNAPTSGWEPGALVFDPHPLALPGDLPPGEYTVGVKVYTYYDGAILPTTDGADYQAIGTVTVVQK
jgi:hypothetical protein